MVGSPDKNESLYVEDGDINQHSSSKNIDDKQSKVSSPQDINLQNYYTENIETLKNNVKDMEFINAVREEEKENINVEYYDDDDDENYTKEDIRFATLPQLIKKLTHHTRFEADFMRMFLQTYREFIDSNRLLWLLILRFNTLPRNDEEWSQFFNSFLVPMRLRVLQVLKTWNTHHSYDFGQHHDHHNDHQNHPTADFSPRDQLIHFLEHLQALDDRASASAASALLRLFTAQASSPSGEQSSVVMYSSPSPKPRYPKRKHVLGRRAVSVLEAVGWPAMEIGRQLTLIESEMYAKIQPNELQQQNWNKPSKESRAPHVTQMIAFTNTIGRWVSHNVVRHTEDVMDRMHYIVKFIKVAEECRHLNNFNGMVEVMSGLLNPAVERLADTWAQVPPKHKERFDQLKDMIRDKALAKALSNAQPPAIPFLGTYLTHLTFIEDGNPSYKKFNHSEKRKTPQNNNNNNNNKDLNNNDLDNNDNNNNKNNDCDSKNNKSNKNKNNNNNNNNKNDNNSTNSTELRMINLGKMRLLGKVISTVELYQHGTPYSLQPVPDLRDRLSSLNPPSLDHIHDLSLKAEPRRPRRRPMHPSRPPTVPKLSLSKAQDHRNNDDQKTENNNSNNNNNNNNVSVAKTSSSSSSGLSLSALMSPRTPRSRPSFIKKRKRNDETEDPSTPERKRRKRDE